MRKLIAATTAVMVLFFGMAGTATAQEPTGALEASPATVDAAGETEFTVNLSGFSPGLALFVLPCAAPAGGDMSQFDAGTACDQSQLTPVVADDDGNASATATYEVTADGLVIVAGDAARTEFGIAIIPPVGGGDAAAEEEPAEEEAAEEEAAAGGPTVVVSPGSVEAAGDADFTVEMSGFSAGFQGFVLPCNFPSSGNIADLNSGTDCDLGNLLPVTMGDDGTASADVSYEVPEDGLIIAVGDAAQTEVGLGIVTVGGGGTGGGDASADLADTGVETGLLAVGAATLLAGGAMIVRQSRKF